MAKQGDRDAEKRPSTPDDEESDPVAEVIGEYGRWQLKMTFLLSLCSFPCTFHIFSPTFLAAREEYWCARPEQFVSTVPPDVWRNFSQPHGSCSIADVDWTTISPDQMYNESLVDASYIPCTDWEWDTSVIKSTIVSEWKMVCDREYLYMITDMLFLTGVGVGGVVSGMISDRFGRKKTLIMAIVLQTLFAFSLTFCPWYELYLVLRVLLGFSSVSVVFSGFVLAMELVGGKWRTIVGVCNFFPLPVSYIIVAALSMALPNWRHLQLALSVPGLFLIGLWWIVPESPRWLLTMGRINEVKEILIEATKFNKLEMPASIEKILQPNGKPSEEDHSPEGILDLIRMPMGRITACVFAVWGATTIVYYGLVLNISSFGGKLHITSILSGVVEIPAIALSIPILMKLGRRYPICLTVIFAGLGCFAVCLVDLFYNVTWIKITFVMMSKFLISATNGVLPMYTAELYPTLMRNLGVGASQVMAGISLVCIPYLWTIREPYPMIIMGTIGVLGGLCVLLLPETANRALKNTIQYDDKSHGHPNSQREENRSNHNGPGTLIDTKPTN